MIVWIAFFILRDYEQTDKDDKLIRFTISTYIFRDLVYGYLNFSNIYIFKQKIDLKYYSIILIIVKFSTLNIKLETITQVFT